MKGQSMTALTVRRDPFARQELKRQCVTNHQGPESISRVLCSWCGQSPKRLYRYGVESDGGTFYGWQKGHFCNIGCRDSYHG